MSVKLNSSLGMPPQEAPQLEGPLNNLRICFQAADDAGCGGYRCILPGEQMRALGAKVKWTYRVGYGDYANYDIFVFQRPYDPVLAEEIKEVSRMGKVVVVECDDDLHNVPNTSPVYEYYKPSKQKPFNECLRNADGVVVSTPELAKHYYKYNQNVFVAPNSIDFNLGVRDWSGTKDETGRKPGEFVLAFRGGSSHLEDLKIMKPVMKVLMDKYSHLRVSLYSAVELSEWAISYWGIDEYRDRVTIIKPRHFSDYPEALGGPDAYFVPLTDHHFNDGKSELALCEVGALGIPCVASNAAPYRRFAEDGKYALLAKNPNDFITHISSLIDNPQYAKELGQRAKQRVLQNYDLSKEVHNWFKGLEAISQRKREGLVGPPEILKPTNKKKSKK